MKIKIKSAIKSIMKSLMNQTKIKSSPISAVVTSNHYKHHGFTACLLFCHYHSKGLVFDDTKKLCVFFESIGINVIFLSTYLTTESENWIKENLSVLIIRKNIGLDFGAWKDGIAYLKAKQLYQNCSELYLINDSTHCISNFLSDSYFYETFIKNKQTDFIGISESFQVAYHFQSYCLKFNAKVIQSSEFQTFWNNFALINTRSYIINEGEVGLSQLLLNSGFTLKALYNFEYLLSKNNLIKALDMLKSVSLNFQDVSVKLEEILLNEILQSNFNQINPTHQYWILLLITCCPFIKRDLIRNNPVQFASGCLILTILEEVMQDNPMEIHLLLDWMRRGR